MFRLAIVSWSLSVVAFELQLLLRVERFRVRIVGAAPLIGETLEGVGVKRGLRKQKLVLIAHLITKCEN